jgi:hypothetical protein
MSTFIKPDKVISTSIGLLRRELVLPRLVWTDAKFDPSLSRNDTVTIHLPAYLPARTRQMRAGTARVKDQLHERSVDVTLDLNVYKDVPITDEQLTLDISDFGTQVLNPVILGIAEQLEQEVLDVIQGSTYEVTLTHEAGTDDAYGTVVNARLALNDARVPQAGRALAVGSAFEAELLTSDKFVDASQSGSTDTLREALIGRIAGFDVFSAPGLAPDEAVAFHRTAFAMVQRAPKVPDSIKWGSVMSYQGMAIRVIKSYDHDLTEDRFIADSYIGAKAVEDDGYFDANGKFLPTTEPGETLGRSVSITGEADDETITSAAHGFIAGDKVQFSGLTGGAGLSTSTDYHVIGAGLTANTFRVSATPGGSAVNFTTDITAGTASELARKLLVRAVKIVVT